VDKRVRVARCLLQAEIGGATRSSSGAMPRKITGRHAGLGIPEGNTKLPGAAFELQQALPLQDSQSLRTVLSTPVKSAFAQHVLSVIHRFSLFQERGHPFAPIGMNRALGQGITLFFQGDLKRSVKGVNHEFFRGGK
jgi:hypothetical protein